MMQSDFYVLLEISQQATHEEVKSAYRKAAKHYHPDRNPGDKQAVEIFRKVQEAYEVLIDPIKRSRYDGSYKPPKPKPKPKEDFTSKNPEPKYYSDDELAKINCTFFGATQDHGNNILVHLQINKSDLRNDPIGRIVKIKKKPVCMLCNGYGIPFEPENRRCPHCNGSGYLFQDEFMPSLSTLCEHCGGLGYFEDTCENCRGTGLEAKMVAEEVVVSIPPNFKSGNQIIIKGKGERGKLNVLNGNLHVVVFIT